MVMGIAELLAQWESVGVFDYMLPFLLIFAVIFGVLTTTNILGGNKGVSTIISLAIALMTLRLQFVQLFFQQLFPRFGVVLAVIIVVVIAATLFIPKEHMKGWLIGFGIAGGVFALIAVINSFNVLGWFGSYWWDNYWGLTIGAVLLIIVIVAMFVQNAPRNPQGIMLPIGPVRAPAT